MSSALRGITSGSSHFFGFHDLTPWNAATDEMVCLRTETSEDHVPRCDEIADVVVVDEQTGKTSAISSTAAWNWQKGARQRWLPALGRRVIAYNVANATDFECRIRDLDSNTERALPRALYDICDHAGFGLSLNFRRLHRRQEGYGYDHAANGDATGYESDGIFHVDLASGEQKLILSIGDFIRQNELDERSDGHYFTHIQISPDGRRFVFMHRYSLESGGLVNSFVVANSDGTNSRVLLDDKMSHFDWRDNDRVVIWCRKNLAIKKLKESKLLGVARALYRLSRKIRTTAIRQGIYNECFREIDVNTGADVSVGKGVLTEDGHPQINPSFPEIWINDTYPDPQNLLTLMLYNQRTNMRHDLLRLPTQPQLKETTWRCDLHPRWHPAGKRICIDSAHAGRRQMYVVDVSEELNAIAHG